MFLQKDDPLVIDKTHGAFLAIDKVSGEICLDVHDFTEDLKTKEEEMLAAKELVAGDIPTDRIQPVPASKASPNTKLDKSCQFCDDLITSLCSAIKSRLLEFSIFGWFLVPPIIEHSDWLIKAEKDWKNSNDN